MLFKLTSKFYLLLSILLFSLFFQACGIKKSHKKVSSSKKPKTLQTQIPKNIKIPKDYFDWPLMGEISSGFKMRSGKPHEGIDILGKEGSPIVASADGEVVFSGVMRGYGNLVLIRHKDDWFSAYAHNKENKVSKSDKIKKGDLVATVGNTGNAQAYHLHFEIRKQSTPYDPLVFLPKR